MDLFSYVSFIHESSKLLCTCSRKYVKETCTYLYQPLKQNSATEFFFLNSFGLPVFWGSAWATSALAAQASAVRWSSRVRSVMGKIKEFYGNMNIYDCFSEKKTHSTSQSKIPHLTSKCSASLVVWTLTLWKWGHFSELSFSRFPTPTSLRSRKPLLKGTATSSLSTAICLNLYIVNQLWHFLNVNSF